MDDIRTEDPLLTINLSGSGLQDQPASFANDHLGFQPYAEAVFYFFIPGQRLRPADPDSCPLPTAGLQAADGCPAEDAVYLRTRSGDG